MSGDLLDARVRLIREIAHGLQEWKDAGGNVNAAAEAIMEAIEQGLAERAASRIQGSEAPRPDATVTRVEVIDHRLGSPSVGRVFAAWGCRIDLSYQDDGRTLKVFVDGEATTANMHPPMPDAERAERYAAIRKDRLERAAPRAVEGAAREALDRLRDAFVEMLLLADEDEDGITARDLERWKRVLADVDALAPPPEMKL